jgi:epoxyqueuosine reductase QueG
MILEKAVSKVLRNDPDLFYGFADLTGKLSDDFTGYEHAVVIGRRLEDSIIDGIKAGPNLDYWNHYREVNSHLYDLISQISDNLRQAGIPSKIINPTLTDKIIDTRYNDTLRLEFSHKMAATQAGLGWIGKTALFVSGEFGTRVRLATILTPCPAENPGIPVTKSKCGKCDICVEACPADAATGDFWDISVDRDEFFDAFKCRTMCRTLGHKQIGMDKRLCGICVAVCPIGQDKTSDNQ